MFKGTLDACAYVEMLQEHLEPFIEKAYPGGCVFQQDNAPAHSAVHTKEYFLDAGITDMLWPAKSLDLNYIENWWGNWRGAFTRVDANLTMKKI